MRVSILVLVDVGVRQYANGHEAFEDVVSILVLVDLGVRHSGSFSIGSIKSGFNPCFSGCWGSTPACRLTDVAYYMFQTLF